MPNDREVLSEKINNIQLLTINRPDCLNAIDYQTALQLSAALKAADNDDDTSVIILTGSGDKAFCVGQDLKSIAAGEKSALLPKSGWGGMTKLRLRKPLIAAVNGMAYGGGLELALSCDLTIAADTARFSFPEVSRGLFPVGGGVIRMGRLVPQQRALKMLLTADVIDAASALEYGLISDIAPAEKLVEEAISLAERISKNAPMSIRLTKQFFYEAMDLSIDEAFDKNDEIARIISASNDAKEGPRAFAEKREPTWKNK